MFYANRTSSVCTTLALTLAASLQFGCSATVSAPANTALVVSERYVAPRGACTLDGSPRVIAEKVAPSRLEVAAADARLWVRYAERVRQPVVLGLDPESLQVVAATSPSDWPPREGDDAALVPVMWEPAVDGRTDGGRMSRVTDDRTLVRVDADRSLIAWSEGSIEGGYQVRFATVGSSGEAMGDVVRVDRDGSAIEAPVASVGPSGRGVLAFVESNGRGFQLVAVPLECGIDHAVQHTEHGLVAQSAP